MGTVRPDPIRILLVEDDEDDYRIVHDQLSGLLASGSSLRWVRDYNEALEALLTGSCDVCLLDHQLGARSGMELLEEVTRSGCPTPIIFLTGTDNYSIDYTAMKSGAADYLTKDQLSATLLERAMRYAIEIRHKNEELLQSRLMARRQEAELALRESEARYKLAMEATNDGIWDWNLKTGESRRSKAYFAMLGYGAEEYRGDIEEWRGLVHPEDIEFATNALNECIVGKIGAYDIEYRMVHRSGSTVWVHARGKVAVFDEQGNPERMVGTVADITEGKRIEQELRENEEKYRRIFENDLLAICIFEVDTLRFLDVNEAHTRLYGYSRQELLGGMTAPDVSAEPELSHASLHQVGGPATTHVPLRYHRKKDGTIFPVEIVSGQSVFKGKPVIYGMIHDISERVHAEEALRESERRYRELFEAGSDAILFVEGETWQILGANSAASALFGYSREELLTKKNWEISEEPEETCRNTREAMVASGQVITVPLRYLRKKDGTVFPAEVTGRSFFWKKRPVFIASIRDITKRKRAEQERENLQAQLNQAQKLESVGRLAGGVAHDFNNMLGVILGHAEMVLDQIDPADTFFANVTEIRKAALRSADLTRQLLAFARRQTISPKILDLNETVEGMLKMLRRLIGEEIELSWLPAKNLYPVRVDLGQIDQILANLCVNARDAISGMGKITIETGSASFDEDFCSRQAGFVPGEFAMLSVSDNGCGMEEETLGKIFEPFFTTKGVGEGTGLGLATIYGIVRQNNGFIHVYSEPGQGTTFKIHLPRAEEQTMEKPPEQENKDLRGKETVLLVEDEEPMLALGKTILLRHGYEVIATRSPAEALEIVKSHPAAIHLLITDVVMPEMNGKDLRDKIAALKPEIKSIFMSGYTADVIAHHGVLDEGIDFLQKPFSMQTLLEKVREALSQ